MRGAGHAALLHERGRRVEKWQVGPVDRDRRARPLRHFERMAEQAEAGDIGDRMHIGVPRELRADLVQRRHGADHLGVHVALDEVLLDGRRIHADTERLGQDHRIARLCRIVAPDVFFATCTDHSETVDWLGAIDRMAAGDGNAGLRADRAPAIEDLADHVGGNLVDGHAENGERHDRSSAHRIDVGDGVGGRHTAEVEGVVDHRHEEVGGRDHAGPVVELVDRGVVAGLRADEQVGEGTDGGLARHQFAQHGGRKLAAAAPAMREGSQTNDGRVHGRCSCIPQADVVSLVRIV